MGEGVYIMKVYIVIGYIEYEGYTQPYEVFDSKEKAQEYIDNNEWNISSPEIFAMEVL